MLKDHCLTIISPEGEIFNEKFEFQKTHPDIAKRFISKNGIIVNETSSHDIFSELGKMGYSSVLNYGKINGVFVIFFIIPNNLTREQIVFFETPDLLKDCKLEDVGKIIQNNEKSELFSFKSNNFLKKEIIELWSNELNNQKLSLPPTR